MISLSFETAKYNREQEMKEIHLNFHFFRNSKTIPSSLETAKYNREQEMKEIHLNFMNFSETA